MLRPFTDVALKPEDYWRGIVLFGRNVASYKFALAASLLEMKPSSGELIKLSELAVPFSNYIKTHLVYADKQSTSPSSRFLDCCRLSNKSEVTDHDLLETTVKLGFNHVLDAFHVVGQDEIPIQFFVDERKTNKGIRTTDSFSILSESSQFQNLPHENEARWRLVETAWELNVSTGLVEVSCDTDLGDLFIVDENNRRKSVTSSRQALSGYQKGHCFYCFKPFSIIDPLPPDVDHFFPHALRTYGWGENLDGIWNLVLSCQACNRGAGGKFDRIPSLRLLERLSKRNEFLISSHHPLRETLMSQTGKTKEHRHTFLNSAYSKAKTFRIHTWEPFDEGRPLF